jgi:sugar lactone lactonase YvrE
MKQRIFTLFALLCAVVVCVSLFPAGVQAEAPYKTFSIDHKGSLVRTQDAYEPVGTIEKAGDTEFSGPSDIFVDGKDEIYVADTGNKRIVVMNRQGNVLRTFGEDVLQEPNGIFVDQQNSDVYVADTSLGQVLKFDAAGTVTQKFERPNSPLYGKNTPFKPSKVTVDKRGNVYIISDGTTNGVVQMSPFGDFLGFFGTNQSQVSFKIMIQRMMFTETQRQKLFKNIPNSPTNISIDAKGLIYTVTEGDEGRAIKRFNIAGDNLLPGSMFFAPYYTDMYVSRSGNIYAVSQKGFILEFDTEGHLLFSFGAPDDGRARSGLFLNASAIALDSHEYIYVADKESNNIQIFAPTDFALLVHQALDLYKEGLYVKSQQPWSQVQQKNSYFDLAHKGLGDAYYKRQMYSQALDEYKFAGDRQGYSNSLWEIRNRWLQNHLLNVFFVIAGLAVLWKLLKWIHRKTGAFESVVRVKRRISNIRLLRELLFVFRFIKSPLDGFYGIKEERKVSNISAAILYGLFFVEYILSLYYTGFIFNAVEPSDLSLMREFAVVFAPLGLWIASNYLVSTISEGEGKFSEVYQGTIYALAPYLVLQPFIILASNGLTMNDSFVYTFSSQIVFIWCIVLMFMMVKEVHDYTIRETIRNICMTVFTMLILSLVLFIVYVILHQVYDFLHSVIQEARARAEQ